MSKKSDNGGHVWRIGTGGWSEWTEFGSSVFIYTGEDYPAYRIGRDIKDLASHNSPIAMFLLEILDNEEL